MALARVTIAIILFAGTVEAAARPRVRMWLADSLDKVFQDQAAPAGKATPPELLVPRNGHGSVQVVFRSQQTAEGLRLELEPPRRAGAALTAEIRRVGFVPVRKKAPKTADGELARVPPGDFPDPLFPAPQEFTLQAERSQPFWVTVKAPPDARSGIYSGRVTLRAGARKIATVRFRVRVVAAAVPAQQTLKVTNWFNWDEPHLRAHYPQLARQPERYWELLANIGKVMAEHGQNVILTPVFELAQARLDEGAIRYDFSKLDQFIAVFERAGVAGTIEGGHLLGRVSGYDTPMVVPADVVEEGRVARKNLPTNDPRAEEHLRRFLPALREHLKSKGWLERYIQHIHDEPHGEERPIYRRYARIIREALPGVPTVDAISLEEGVDFLEGILDVWTPVLGSFDDRAPVLQDHVSRGGQAWFYTCIVPQGPYLNRFTDYPLLKVRLLHWFNYRHQFSGFLHWGGNYWTEQPFENVEPVINDGKTPLPGGDNAIVYPDAEHLTVLSSMRLETMREGIEDYELLNALAVKNPEKARALAREAIPHFTDYLRDVLAFRELHRRLLASFE